MDWMTEDHRCADMYEHHGVKLAEQPLVGLGSMCRRLGQKMKGMGRAYDYVTPKMRRQILEALEARWLTSLRALRPHELRTLVSWFPDTRASLDALPRDAA